LPPRLGYISCCASTHRSSPSPTSADCSTWWSIPRELIGARTATLERVEAELAGAAAGSPGSPGSPDQATLEVPITVNGEQFGTLVLADSPDGQFSREDLWLANEFAATAGVAIRNALFVAQSEWQGH
jgi:GAF domain-containing protein